MALIIAEGGVASLYPGIGDTIYVPAGIVQIGSFGGVMGAGGVTEASVIVDGTVIGQSRYGIGLDDDGRYYGGHSVLIGETGVVRSAI